MALINFSLAVNDALYHIPNYYVWWNAGSIVSGASPTKAGEMLSLLWAAAEMTFPPFHPPTSTALPVCANQPGRRMLRA